MQHNAVPLPRRSHRPLIGVDLLSNGLYGMAHRTDRAIGRNGADLHPRGRCTLGLGLLRNWQSECIMLRRSPFPSDLNKRGIAMRARLFIGGVAVLAALVPATVSAVPRSAVGSCPAGSSKWELITPEAAAEETYGDLLDPPFSQLEYQTEIEGYNVNGDGFVCLARRAQKNEQAHWFEYPLFVYKDNNTGAG